MATIKLKCRCCSTKETMSTPLTLLPICSGCRTCAWDFVGFEAADDPACQDDALPAIKEPPKRAIVPAWLEDAEKLPDDPSLTSIVGAEVPSKPSLHSKPRQQGSRVASTNRRRYEAPPERFDNTLYEKEQDAKREQERIDREKKPSNDELRKQLLSDMENDLINRNENKNDY